MGMFDTIVAECPFCQREYEGQTKLGECTLAVFRPGDRTSMPNGRTRLKKECECGEMPVAVVDGGKFLGLVKDDEDRRELYFGAVEEREHMSAAKERAFVELLEAAKAYINASDSYALSSDNLLMERVTEGRRYLRAAIAAVEAVK